MKQWFYVKELCEINPAIPENIFGIAEWGHVERVVSYLFVGKKKALLFDSGMGIGDISKCVKEAVLEVSKKNLPVSLINSHCHYDHIGGNHYFDEIAIFDDKFSKRIAKVGYKNKEILPCVINGFDKDYEIPEMFSKESYCVRPFKYNRLVKDGTPLNFEPFRFSIVHTPGHTSDSICLYENNHKLLLTGDTLYLADIYLFFRNSDLGAYLSSVQRLSELQSDSGVKAILPSHNGFSCDPEFLSILAKRLRLPLGFNQVRLTRRERVELSKYKNMGGKPQFRISDKISLLTKSEEAPFLLGN